MLVASPWSGRRRGTAIGAPPLRQALAALRGLMKVLGSRFSRFAARFSFIDIFAAFFMSRSCGVLSDIDSRFPLLAGGEPPTIAIFRRKSIRGI